MTSSPTQRGHEPATDSSGDVEEQQSRLYQLAVGKGVSRDVVSRMQVYVQDARPFPIYASLTTVPFIYEVLVKDRWNDEVKIFATEWINNEANLQRASNVVGRRIPDRDEVMSRTVAEAQNQGIPVESVHERHRAIVDRSYLLRGFCIFRLRAKVQEREWMRHSGYLGVDSSEPQTVVFCALDDLSSHNGFIMTLPAGSDVCLDSIAHPLIPNGGGGVGIFLALNI